MNDLFFDNRIAGLILKFLQDDITEEERRELYAWKDSSPRAKEIFDELTSEERLPDEVAYFESSGKRVLNKIHKAAPDTRVVVELNSGFRWKRWLAAAVLVGLAVSGYFLLVQNKKEEQSIIVKKDPVADDVAPGKDGAVLQLSDGRKIVLDELKDGEVVKIGDVAVVKEGGKLIYKPSHAGVSDLEYNTMTTPKGRTHKVELSDGSVVWLNAASSLRYPVVFGKKERRVEVTGEAYFEVAKDASRKFVVVGPGGFSTEVLGTRFNINSYGDDVGGIKVTLIEGRIKVNKENSSLKPVILKPGQQAAVSEQSNSSKIISVQTANVDEVMAWKNGLFKFQSTPMQEMMRQIARWYDVEIEYEGDIKDDPVSGTMPRNTTASEALTMLKLLGYKFTIKGKKITVMP